MKTAADQPTTEPSEADIEAGCVAVHGDFWGVTWLDPAKEQEFRQSMRNTVRAILVAVAPAPQPAADTETEVQ